MLYEKYTEWSRWPDEEVFGHEVIIQHRGPHELTAKFEPIIVGLLYVNQAGKWESFVNPSPDMIEAAREILILGDNE